MSHNSSNESLAGYFAAQPPELQQQQISQLTDADFTRLLYDWRYWARPNQLRPEGDWYIWLVCSGRGFGKTRVGAETVRQMVAEGRRYIALIGQTSADVRKTMIEGESGLLNCYPPGERPSYEPSKRQVTWPNGAIATTYSAEEPGQLRGPQHDFGWVDELAKFDKHSIHETWDNFEMGLRLGSNPQAVVTTTPRPIKLLKDLIADSQTVVTRGSMYENIANLPRKFIQRMVRKYEGTRLGRQELFAEILDDMPGAYWTHAALERNRVVVAPELRRIVVAIDPAVSSQEDSDSTGIIVAAKGLDGRGYVLADRSCKLAPLEWARRAIGAYYEFKADRIVAEVNNGGDMIEALLRQVDRNVAFTAVHASHGKAIRAEPISALYEQNRISHVGMFADLEDQMTMMSPDGYGGDGSPDKVDALVWALTELFEGTGAEGILEFYQQQLYKKPEGKEKDRFAALKK